jgi:hypothetical protein
MEYEESVPAKNDKYGVEPPVDDRLVDLLKRLHEIRAGSDVVQTAVWLEAAAGSKFDDKTPDNIIEYTEYWNNNPEITTDTYRSIELSAIDLTLLETDPAIQKILLQMSQLKESMTKFIKEYGILGAMLSKEFELAAVLYGLQEEMLFAKYSKDTKKKVLSLIVDRIMDEVDNAPGAAEE